MVICYLRNVQNHGNLQFNDKMSILSTILTVNKSVTSMLSQSLVIFNEAR